MPGRGAAFSGGSGCGGLSGSARRATRLAVALALGLCGCPEPEAPPPPVSQTLRIVLRGDPGSLDPLSGRTSLSLAITSKIFEPLIDLDASLKPVPRLAVAWWREKGGAGWRFRLRPGVRWQSGAELDAADVQATLRRMLDPRTPSLDLKSTFAGVGDVQTTGPLEIRVPFGRPAPSSFLSWQRLPILERGGAADPRAVAEHPSGSGPYRLAAWRQQEWILLERNPDWWGGTPPIRFLLFRIIPDALTAVRALQSGEVDIAPLRFADRPPERKNAVRYRVLTFDPQLVYVVVWNLRDAGAPFTDPRVRRALTLGFNRQKFVDKVRRGTARVAATLYTPLWRSGRPALDPLPYDPVEAGRLLDAAGWRDTDGDGWRDRGGRPFSFPLLYSAEDEVRRDAALVLQSDLARLGVQVRLDRAGPLALVRRLRHHDFVAAVHAWALDPEPSSYDFFHSSQAAEGLNYGGYSHPDLDRLVEAEAGASDPASRARAGLPVERWLRDQAPLLFICQPIGLLGVSERVRGFEVGPLGPLAGYLGVLGTSLSEPSAGELPDAGRPSVRSSLAARGTGSSTRLSLPWSGR